MNGFDNSVSSAPAQPPTESSAPVSKRRSSSRIQVSNLPADFTSDQIDQVLSVCGTVKKSSLVSAESGRYIDAIFETPEDALKAVEQLNEKDFQGNNLKAELITNGNAANGRLNRGGVSGNSGFGGRSKNGQQQGNNRGAGYPLRLLIPSEYVGAIIGRQGQTIRSITTRCKARVDVHGKENSGLVEKIISIYGQPENCTAACREILAVMEKEAAINSRGEVMLKMLADDRYCGRIIGKEGKMIKKIRDDTATKITVSNSQELAALLPDRVIAVRGSVDGMAQAEASISAKLAECMDHEQQQQQSSMGIMTMAMPMGSSYYSNSGPYYDYGQSGGYYAPMYAGSYGGRMSGSGGMGLQQMGYGGGTPGGGGASETCQIGVPNPAVGAIIGTAGSNIKQIMRESGAFVNIEAKKDGDQTTERIVSIKGSGDSCWRASYMVFEKMKVEGFGGMDEVRLRTLIRVPRETVGLIIGKGGRTVREIQHATGAMIKLPEEQSAQGPEVAVECFGNFMATQAAHGRIRALISKNLISSNGGGPSNLQRGARRGGSAPPQATAEEDVQH